MSTNVPAGTIQLYWSDVKRKSEMDNDSRQSLEGMPCCLISVRDEELLSEVVDRAIDQFDPLGETPSFYLWQRRSRPVPAYYLAFVPDDVPDNQPYAWTSSYTKLFFILDTSGRVSVSARTPGRMTVSDLKYSAAAGHVRGNWSRIVVTTPRGFGDAGLGGDLATFLLDHGVDLALGGALTGVTAVLRKFRPALALRARRTVQDWEIRGVDKPWIVRSFVDSKSEWEISVLSRRLSIPRRSARALLASLGYEERKRSRTWLLGHSSDAKRRRQEWIADEWRSER